MSYYIREEGDRHEIVRGVEIPLVAYEGPFASAEEAINALAARYSEEMLYARTENIKIVEFEE